MLLTVGRIGRAHGVKGEATIEVRTDDPDERFAIGAQLVTEPAERGPLTIKSGRVHNGVLLLSFDGVEDRNAVEALRGTLLLADVDLASANETEDDFHDLQLIGMQVITSSGALVGTVTEVIHLPAQDLLAVERDGDEEILIPFVREIVPSVDLSAKRITINPPAGLLGEVSDED